MYMEGSLRKKDQHGSILKHSLFSDVIATRSLLYIINLMHFVFIQCDLFTFYV